MRSEDFLSENCPKTPWRVFLADKECEDDIMKTRLPSWIKFIGSARIICYKDSYRELLEKK